MAADMQAVQAGSSAISPLDRDPRKFPFGVLLVAPGIFEAVSGFAWFATEAEAVEYLRHGVWTEIELNDDRKQACMHVFGAALAGDGGLSQAVLDRLGQSQDELLVLWAGTFQAILDGSDDFVLELLASTAEQVEMPELPRVPEGVLRLMAQFRWQSTEGTEGIRTKGASLPHDDQQSFLSELRSAIQNSCP